MKLFICGLYDEFVHGVAGAPRRTHAATASPRCLRQRRCFSRFPSREREWCDPSASLRGVGAVRVPGGFSSVGQPGLRVLTPRASSALGLAIEDSLPLLFLPFLGQRDVVDGRVPPSCVVVVRAMAFPPSRNVRPAKEGRQVSDGNVVRQCFHAEVPVLGDEYRFTVQLHWRIRFPWKYMVNTVLA